MRIGEFFIIGMFGYCLSQVGCSSADNKTGPVNPAIIASPAPMVDKRITSDEFPIKDIIAGTPPELLARAACEPAAEVDLKISGPSAPVTVKFDASASTAPCGKIIVYAWEFGDGTNGLGSRIRHTYKKPGSYTASLFLVDNGGHITLIRPNYEISVKDKTSDQKVNANESRQLQLH
jgi:PKD repeat protein